MLPDIVLSSKDQFRVAEDHTLSACPAWESLPYATIAFRLPRQWVFLTLQQFAIRAGR